MIRVSRPKQTNFGSMLFYRNNGKQEMREFATEDEATEFAKELEMEIDKLKLKEERK